MSLIGRRIKLEIDDPWDDQKIIIANIIQFFTKDKKDYLIIKDNFSAKRFVVTNRYIEDNISEIILGKKVIVAIVSQNKDDISDENPEDISNLIYSGIGSIEMSPNK